MKPADMPPVDARVDADTLEAELEWLAHVIELRLHHYFHDKAPGSPPLPGTLAPPPALRPGAGPYAAALQRHGFDATERLLMILALAPPLRPQLLDVLATQNAVTQRPYTEFGAHAGPGGAMLPTVETACFLVAGDDLARRFEALQRLAPQQRLARDGLLHTEALPQPDAGGLLQSLLAPSPAFLAEALPGPALPAPPDRTALATRVQTGLRWEDLVLPAATLAQLEDIHLWLAHGQRLLHDWGFGRRTGRGHVSLFHGPSGTGKTLSACLIGERCGREVHRVDLSLVVSKYIGETEKNLSRLFDAAERDGWILFFDEADALFGKRTSVSDAHDRYANQEVSYLLQRIEGFDGVVILASNLRHNIDDAFLRRFQSVVQFPLPRPPERLRLWREGIPDAVRPDPALDLTRLAQQHELSGGTIVNVLRHACLRSLARGDGLLRAEDVDEGVRRELLKEGRAL
ncbi:ATP-binding protein [Variovorax sp. IB41]|uniref:ATP-binding protein n=1 Tax=Variovorax sp. IB41 TaxID=2779370 RepID=UPI0018E7F196|nr:ATP-binding protein [Variovorax sp. IB41]MBJ2158001.1 AAA family ATPase [Variovorax sp. IB41]